MTPPISEHEPFLRAIIEAPDDDAVRLVYSDWLEENGDIERATYIRTSIQLARAEVKNTKLVNQNRDQHAKGWKKWLAHAGIDWQQTGFRPKFQRGFIEAAHYLGSRPFFANADRLFAIAPLQSITIDCFQLDDASLLRLARMPELLRLHTLNLLGHQRCSTGAWTALFRSNGMQNLKSLSLDNCNLGERETRVLASSPMLTKLQRLCLDSNDPGVAGCRALIDSPFLQNLRFLDITECEFANDSEWELDQLMPDLYTRFVLGPHYENVDAEELK